VWWREEDEEEEGGAAPSHRSVLLTRIDGAAQVGAAQSASAVRHRGDFAEQFILIILIILIIRIILIIIMSFFG